MDSSLEHSADATMNSLTEWYRYVDRVSRPARRGEEDEAPIQAWRPWLDAEETEHVPEALRREDVRDLSVVLGGAALTEVCQFPREEFEDLTVNDELPSMPEYQVPDLTVPSFELRAPQWGGADPEPEEAPEPPLTAESGAKGGASVAAPPTLDNAHGWELLERARGESDGAGKPRPRESRQKLIERLVDPVLTLEEAAQILQVCPTTVRRYTNKGLLRHFRTQGNQRRFRLSDVAEFMKSRAAEIEADSRADQAAARG
jgi:excisionase family DNA binding protein